MRLFKFTVFLLLFPSLIFGQFIINNDLVFEGFNKKNYSFDLTNDGGYIIVGDRYSEAKAFKSNELGEIIFETTFGGFYPHDVSRSNNDYIITRRVGTGGTYTTNILKINDNGEIIFDNQISDGGHADDVLVLNDNSYIVSGGTQPCGCGGSWNTRVSKFSSNGSSQWTNEFCLWCQCSCNIGDEIAREAISINNQIYVVGYLGQGANSSQTDGFLIRYDNNGGQLSTNTFGNNVDYTGFNSIAKTNNNEIVAVGYNKESSSLLNSKFWIIKTDLFGNLVWELNLQNENYPDHNFVAHDILISQENDFFIVGVGYNQTDEDFVWLIKTDQNGNIQDEIKIFSDDIDMTHQSLVFSEDESEIFVLYGDNQNLYLKSFLIDDIPGCTDQNACNYSDLAQIDDGSCIFPDTTYFDILTCDTSYFWIDGVTYTESGTSTYTFSSIEIGANIEGGIVFYVDSSSNLAYVATQNYINEDIQWGCSNFDVDGAESTSVGGGYQNTQDIINASCGSNQSAALTCVNYDNGYNDWFLPSLEELYLIYENLYQTELVSYNTGNSQNWYWSSTEGTNNSTNSASNINFSDGFIAENNNKDSNGGGVIAVRTFSINNSCDSVAVLNLTINQSDTSIINVTTCESYEWNGEVYTESGTYSYSGITNNNNFSLNFNNQNDWISIPSIVTGNNYTLQIWAKFPLPSTLDGHNTFFSDWNTGGAADIVHLFFHNICGLGIGDQYASGNCNVSGVYGTGFMPSSVSNGWHLISVVSEPNQTTFYIDNQNVGSVNHSVSSPIVAIGNNSGGNGVAPQNAGNIDMPTIWNYSLSAEEIEQYMNCPPIGVESGLIAYWNFEEGVGTTIYDQTSNGNNGAINGASYNTNVPSQSCQLTNTNGCDSTAILNLTINSSNTGVDTQAHCHTYTWIDGITYTVSNNTAIHTLTNAAGCDSVVTLDLIINNSDITSSSVTACDDFTWGGQTYSESGEYTNTYTNDNGCDSTHTLNLTINNSISSNTETSSCSSYEWNGMIYENGGNYEFDTLASNGCDSTAVLELEICYLDQLEINGPTAAVTSTTSSFSVQDNTSSAFIWSIEGLGIISSGQFTNEIFIDWSEIEGITNVCVYEKYDCYGLECLGDTMCLEVELKRPADVVENNLEVYIYPNPSSNIFNLEFKSDSGTEILVTNVLGEQVYFESFQSVEKFNTQIDLSNYSKGIYNLTIKNTNGISNHKLILQ